MRPARRRNEAIVRATPRTSAPSARGGGFFFNRYRTCLVAQTPRARPLFGPTTTPHTRRDVIFRQTAVSDSHLSWQRSIRLRAIGASPAVSRLATGRPITPRSRASGTARRAEDCPSGVSVDPQRCAREGWRARRACWCAATRRRRAGWASPRLFARVPPWRTRRGASTRRGTPRGGRSPRAGAWRASPISTCARSKNGWCPRTARKVRRATSPGSVPLSNPTSLPRRVRDEASIFPRGGAKRAELTTPRSYAHANETIHSSPRQRGRVLRRHARRRRRAPPARPLR